jgi:DNA-binding NarL/FixJ family response regulator
MTSIAIIEDNDTVRQTLREWIDGAPGCRCVCACATSKEALAALPRHFPDVALMDINLPGGESGIVCTARLKELLPRLQIIMLTVYKDHDLIFQALKAGACGYLLKRSSREEILRAIAEVQTGGAPMTGEVARMLVETFQKTVPRQPETGLSPREMEILVLVAKGLTNKEIATQLNISFDTVRNHLRHIYEKLHVRCRTEAVMKYSQSGGTLKNSIPGKSDKD